jgi:ABC-type dipeptide/oligopeptide/nickel transport system ATPase component
MSDQLDYVVRKYFSGDPAARALLVASADPNATAEERQRADDQLVELEKQRILAARGEGPPDPDTWEANEALRGLDLGARDKGPEPHRTRFRAAADVMRDRPAEAVLEGLLYRSQVTVLVAESGAGKSFVVSSIAGAIVDPNVTTWAGREVLTGSVAMVLYERDAVPLRLRALEEQGHDLSDLHVLFASEPLSPMVGRDGPEFPSAGELGLVEDLVALRAKLEAAGRPPLVFVAVDTIRASMNGTEDSSRDVSAYLRAISRIASAGAPGAAVGLVHHMGWQDGDQARKRERGSSALRGNVDVTLLLEADADQADPHEVHLLLRTVKNRDEERGAPIRLIRRRVVLNGFGPKGRLLTSCVIEQDRRTVADLEAEAQAAQEAADRELDQRVLRAIHQHAPTSLDALRMAARVRRDVVYATLSRLVSVGLARRAVRGEPFALTAEGLQAIGEPPPPPPSPPSPPSPDRPRDGAHDRPHRPPPTGADGTSRAGRSGRARPETERRGRSS